MTSIHPTAIIEEGAEIDSSVVIGAYSVVGSEVKIGKGTKLHSHVVVDGITSIGEGNEIFPFVSIGKAPQDLKFAGEKSSLIIGDRNKIREFVTMQPGTETGNMTTVIGSDNLFMANCHVAHDCIIGSHNVIANSVAVAGHVEVSNHVIIGGLAGIHQFARLGQLSFVGAGSMVSQDVPPFCIVQGDRAELKGLNLIGLRRASLKPDELVVIKKAYKHFFANTGNLKEKVQTLPLDLKNNEKLNIFIKFIESSERGIVSPSRYKSSQDDSE